MRTKLTGLTRLMKGSEEGRILTGPWLYIVSAIAIAMALFHIYSAGFGMLAAMKHRAVHLGFVLVLVFLISSVGKKHLKKIPVWDVALAVVGATVCLYLVVFYEEIVLRAGEPSNLDLLMGAICILLVLEGARRTIGIVLPLVASLFIIYAAFGTYMPVLIGHRDYSASRIIEHLYLTLEGILGTPIMVSSTFVVMFVLFGAFLDKTGVGKIFTHSALGLLGHSRGGPAKAAVLSSGLVGMVSGSSTANVVTTGAFTIPLMKRIGFKPHVAGGIEVASSTNGQFTPPIMGAAAFVMAIFLEVPYTTVALIAIAPSILDYAAILFLVDLEARKSRLEGLPRDELPNVKEILMKSGHMLIPPVLMIVILIMGYTPMRAALWGIIACIGVAYLRKETRPTLLTLIEALKAGAINAVRVAIACACAGIAVGVITLSGLGFRITDLIVELGGGNVILTLILASAACIILGLGVPTTANYIITATMVAPALIKFGIAPFAAHLFVFYYGVAADDTPPVGLAAYAASGIAHSNPITTGIQGAKFDLSGFLLPYIWALSPVMVLVDFSPIPFIWTYISAIGAIFAFSVGIQNYMLRPLKIYERLLMLACGIMFIPPYTPSRLIAFAIVLTMILLQKIQKNRLGDKVSW